MKKILYSKYLIELTKMYPKITSGRKNYLFAHKRILKNIELIKKFKKSLIKKNN